MTDVGARDVRAVLVDVAGQVLREHGAAGLTTRRVAERAGVQAPTIYRVFGDKDGLLDAVAEQAMATFVAEKATTAVQAADGDVDPVADLWVGWRTYLDFGLVNPALFALLSDPDRARRSSAVRSGQAVLAARVHRVALAGRLQVGESEAVELIHAAGTGAVLALLAGPAGDRDPRRFDALFGVVLARIVADVDPPDAREVLAPVVAVRALAPQLDTLTETERGLLVEWLNRVVDAS
ncbi:TetR/AcrR family transcriptional regulator [uncultured Jatrophihabitans sp.]|uniref:TetR/AcrR family transcriptional regulator n=1 Tax=uncultured Jatrophihabitans sp. TaxID=1610747 RepID=UPI0035CC7250